MTDRASQFRAFYRDLRIDDQKTFYEKRTAEAEIDWDAAEPDADVMAQMDQIEKIFRTENGQWGQLIKGAAKATPAVARRSVP